LYQTFTDSLQVDYPVGSKIESENKVFCSSRWLSHRSPFSSFWDLPSGERVFGDSIFADKEGRYILNIENGSCLYQDTAYLIPGSFLNLDIAASVLGKELKSSTIEMPLPSNLVLSTGQAVCNMNWFENELQIGSGPTLERQIEREGFYIYKVEGSQSNGCLAIGKDTLWIRDSSKKIPNLITANGDNKNDYFEIPALPFWGTSEIVIFNRWGQKVFSASPYQNNWPQNDTQEGAYFYRLEAAGKEFTGWVQVMK
jgi:gliding motility-associated-like protein